MKNKKFSVAIILAITVFATLICLYSSKLSEKSVTAGRVITGEITEALVDSSINSDCSDKDCFDGECKDKCDGSERITNPNGSDCNPIIGKRPPKHRIPPIKRRDGKK